MSSYDSYYSDSLAALVQNLDDATLPDIFKHFRYYSVLPPNGIGCYANHFCFLYYQRLHLNFALSLQSSSYCLTPVPSKIILRRWEKNHCACVFIIFMQLQLTSFWKTICSTQSLVHLWRFYLIFFIYTCNWEQ